MLFVYILCKQTFVDILQVLFLLLNLQSCQRSYLYNAVDYVFKAIFVYFWIACAEESNDKNQESILTSEILILKLLGIGDLSIALPTGSIYLKNFQDSNYLGY